MEITKQETGLLSHVLRYSLWTLGVLAVVGIVTLVGTSLNAYNDEGSWPCVWQYDEDTSLEVPYRNHSMPTAYYDAFQDGIDEWDDADTAAEFDFTTSQDNHYLGSLDRPHVNVFGKTEWWCLALVHKRSSSYSWLNEAYLDAESSTFKKSVATHELGHYIGARNSDESPAIMNPDGDNDTIYDVYEDDECAINDRYEHEDYPVTCD